MRVSVTVKLTAVKLTPNMWLKSAQRELPSYTISRVKFESTWFFPFQDLRFQFSLSKWCTRDTRTPSFKLFRSRLRGLILPWFIAAIREIKISRHLRVVLNDSTPFNYTHRYFSHSTAILLHLQGSHWKTAPQINWFSPTQAEIVKNRYNFPLRRLFHQNDLVLLFMFYSWNTGFTFQDFRSITKSCQDVVTPREEYIRQCLEKDIENNASPFSS